MIEREIWIEAAAALGKPEQTAKADYDQYLALRALVAHQRAKFGSMDMADLIADSVLRGLWLGEGRDPYWTGEPCRPTLVVLSGGETATGPDEGMSDHG